MPIMRQRPFRMSSQKRSNNKIPLKPCTYWEDGKKNDPELSRCQNRSKILIKDKKDCKGVMSNASGKCVCPLNFANVKYSKTNSLGLKLLCLRGQSRSIRWPNLYFERKAY